MSGPIYSERFLLGKGHAANFYYNVPAGHRAVVKSISTGFEEAGEGFNFQINGYLVAEYRSPGPHAAFNLATTMVVYAGGQMWLTVVGTYAGVIVSGYLFVDDSGRRDVYLVADQPPGEDQTPRPGEPAP